MYQEQNNQISICINPHTNVIIDKNIFINIFENFLNEYFKGVVLSNLVVSQKKITILLKHNAPKSEWISDYDQLIKKIYNSIRTNFNLIINSVGFVL